VRRRIPRLVPLIGLIVALVLPHAVTAAPAAAIPPNIPSAATAASRLDRLTVAPESHHSGYDRSLFPHWITISGTCNTP